MIFSHVKIFSFSAKAHLVFHWCLYNKSISLNGYGKRNVCPFSFPSRHVSSRKVTFSRVPYKKNRELKINHKERLAAINHRRAVRIKFRGQSIFVSRWRCREVIINRDFKIQRRGRPRERQKNNRSYKQNNSFARASHFFCTFLSRFCTTTT